ncbi:hypothetical protein ACOBV8_21345 (plasmid) [Pseudoalteromonas espejiana]
MSAYINNALDEEAYTSVEPASGRYPTGYVAVVNPQTLAQRNVSLLILKKGSETVIDKRVSLLYKSL